MTNTLVCLEFFVYGQIFTATLTVCALTISCLADQCTALDDKLAWLICLLAFVGL